MRQRKRDEEETQYDRLYICYACGEDYYHEKRLMGERFEELKLVHVQADLNKNHPPQPTPKIIGVNYQITESGGLRRIREIELRPCGYCAQPIFRKLGDKFWEHAQQGAKKWLYDHPAKVEPPTHEECIAYRDKFQMMVHADHMERGALGLTPIQHFLRAKRNEQIPKDHHT